MFGVKAVVVTKDEEVDELEKADDFSKEEIFVDFGKVVVTVEFFSADVRAVVLEVELDVSDGEIVGRGLSEVGLVLPAVVLVSW